MPDLPASLGVGVNTAAIYDRTGRRRLVDLAVSSLTWNRLLSDVSESEVVVPADRCTPALAQVQPYAHSLVIHRSGERVWEGPITRTTDSRNALTIKANDVARWLDKRAQRDAILATPAVTAAMQASVLDALSPDDPNVAAWVQVLGSSGLTVEREVEVAKDTYLGDLGTLVKAGGRWTTAGRAIFLWDVDYNPGTLALLRPEDHLLAAVDVVRDGDLLGTYVTARNDDGVLGSAGDRGSPDAFYGLVERLTSAGAGPDTPDALAALAERVRETSYPLPPTLVIPSGATVRCDAPFPIRNLIPGQRIPVAVRTATRRNITGTFVLTAVSVEQSGTEAERVSITLAPTAEAA